ncbi:DUF4129 domain-containing protein [Ornithinimicrobium sp. Y1694]|uniref:DUF4129 domain-containing protein n=1 Tax=Ornithinimicrobium sp. Y1694 TaxID=3418590 RepID=UPI003CED6068
MRRGNSTVVIAIVAALAALSILIWSSSSGEPLVSSPQGTWGEPRATEPRLPLEPLDIEGVPEQIGPEEEPEEQDIPWLTDLAIALFVMAVVVFLLLVARWAGRQRVEEKKRLAAAEEKELVALLDATGEDVRYHALSEGDPRNGVVACWVALEETVHRSGLEQDRSETSAELTTRVLRRWEVDQDAIDALSASYREARFSRHPITEEERLAAVEALDRIHTDLRRRIRAEEELREAEERKGAHEAGDMAETDDQQQAEAGAHRSRSRSRARRRR